MTADALRRLIEAVEKGATPGVGWTVPVFGEAGFAERQDCRKAFRGDLNAAVALHKALLPGWVWTMHGNGQAVVWPPGTADVQNAGCIETDIEGKPARALLLAILRAKLKEVEHG